jgi:hypothetical protein
LARTTTLLQLRTDIAEEADISGMVGVAQRYTPAALTRRINQSIQRFREKISNEGVTHYLTSTSGTLSVGATSPFPFLSLDLSAVSPSIVRTYGVDLTIDSVTRSLRFIPFTLRDQFGGPLNKSIPAAWSHYQTRVIAIFPPADSAYAYTVWYLPVLADLANDGDTFDGVAGWEEYIIYDVITRLNIKDQYANIYAQLVDYKRDLMADIIKSATKVSQAGGASIGRDTLGERANWGRRSRWLPPP